MRTLRRVIKDFPDYGTNPVLVSSFFGMSDFLFLAVFIEFVIFGLAYVFNFLDGGKHFF